jgi:hypothetical protein
MQNSFSLKKDKSSKRGQDIVFVELPFHGFTIELVWLPYDKAGREAAKSIVKESSLHKRRSE